MVQRPSGQKPLSTPVTLCNDLCPLPTSGQRSVAAPSFADSDGGPCLDDIGAVEYQGSIRLKSCLRCTAVANGERLKGVTKTICRSVHACGTFDTDVQL